MAGSSIRTREKNISLEFIKKTAGYIAGATGGFVSDVMPVTSSTISGAKNGLQELNSTFSNTANSIMPKISQLKSQGGFRSITNWFMQREEDFNNSDNAADLPFDVDVEDNSMESAEAQLSESTKNADKLSKVVLESSSKLVDSQISATANLIASADRQTAVISSGFDKTNSTLNKILEVSTKNTTALIEATVAGGSHSNDQSPNDRLASGKFKFDDYKKMVSGNLKNSEFGMIAGMLSMVSGMGGMLTPKDLIQYGIGMGADKFAPNLKKNMQALDSAVGDVIMNSLIRLGENRNDMGVKGRLARVFGIDSSRKDVSTQKSSLELKNVSFNSLAQEALVGAIPGYLRHLLIAVGGPDITYDFKSKSFKNNNIIKKEFDTQAISSVRGSLNNAGGDIKKHLGDDKFSHMVYDLMMNDLGTKTSNSIARDTISKFGNKQETQDYILQTVLSGMQLSDAEVEAAKKFSENLGNATIGMGSHQMMNQVTRNNVNRNKNMERYVREANDYGMDLSFIDDNPTNDRNAIAKSYGKNLGADDNTGSSKASVKDSVAKLSGVNYTNMALYEIYRRLNEGINVFQVGKSNHRKTPFKKFGDDYLVRPLGHKPKQTGSNDLSSSLGESTTGPGGVIHDDGSDNLLQNQTLEDGSVESLSKGQRFTRWGKQRGGNLAKAMFNGDAQQVKDAFGLIVRDVTQVGGEQFKKGMTRINDSFGNVSGFMKHKLFGTGYSYDSGETDKDGNPVKVHIKDNKGGGIFGVVQDNILGTFKNGKEKSTKWIKDVMGYFDFKGSGDKEEKAIESKRKQLIFSSAGAMAGAGILGGPVGLLVGAVAGNALTATGIGERIKGLLFGKKDEKSGLRDKKGLVGRAVDGILDPIKYQVGKSFNTLSKVLKKNVMGPLSDIGVAIKSRITDVVAETSKTAFGKVFGFIGKMLMLPFKGIASTAKLPINLAGSIFRGLTGMTGSAVGSSLGMTASMIATKDGRKEISERKKLRNAQIDKDYENDYSGGFKSWKSKQDDRRSENWDKLKNSTMEEKMTQEEISDSNKQIEENTKLSADAVAHLDHLGSEAGSIFTHDEGLHGRIDKLVELLGGKKKKSSGISEEDKTFVDSMISGTSSLMSTDGVVSTEEARLGVGIIDEAAKTNPSKSSVISKFKNLIGIQAKRKDDDGNKKESFLEKILKNWQLIAAGIAAGLALMNGNVQKLIGGIGSKLFDAGKDLWKWIKDGNKDGKSGNAPLNALTSPLDMRTNNASNYLNPFADINHVTTDAAGNDITNINATRAKDAPWYHLAAQGIRRGASSVGYGMDADRHKRLAEKADAKGWQLASAKQRDMAASAETKAAQRSANPFGWGSSGVARGMGTLGVGLAGGQLVGKAAGGITSKVLQNYGVDEEWADRGGRVAETGATIKGTMSITKSAATEGGTANKIIKWCMDKSMDIMDMLGQKIANSKSLSAAAKPVSEFLSKAKGSITEKAMVPLIERITQLAAKCGVQATAGALTAGVANAVMAGSSAIIQGCNTENLFGVSPGQADGLMTTIATALGGVFGLPFVCLVEIIDVILAPVNDGKGIRQSLAEIIYNALKGDGGASLSEKQDSLQGDVDSYNEKYGTNLDRASYNDMVNQGMIDKIWTGGTKMKDGHAVFKDNGERDTNGGLRGMLKKPMDMVSQGIDTVTTTASEIGSSISALGDKASDIGSFAKDVVAKNIDWIITGNKSEISLKPDDPFFDLKRGIFTVAGLTVMPVKGIVDIGKGIYNFIKNDVVSPILNNKIDSISAISGVINGDYTIMDSQYWPTGESSNGPLGPLGSVMSYTDRIMSAPIAMLGWVGTNALKYISSMISDGSRGISDASEDVSSVISGNMTIFDSAYWSSDIDDDDPNPLGKVGKVAGFVQRLFSAPGAMIGWVGTKAIESFKNISDGISPIIDEGEATIQQAINGDISPFSDQFWEAPTSPPGSILGGLAVGASYIAKTMSLPLIIIKMVTRHLDKMPALLKKAFKSFFGDVTDNVSDNGGVKLKTGGPLEEGNSKLPRLGGIGGPIDPSSQTNKDDNNTSKTSSISTGDPLNKPVEVTSPFGERVHPVTGERKFHKGIDLCPADDTNDAQVGAVYGGKVTAVGYEEGGAGNYVFYQTPDGMTIKNMHMKDGSIPGNITEGATIKPGDKLGDMGTTGASTGPHLHYQIEKDGSPIDPSPFIDGSKALSSFNGGSAPGGSNGSKQEEKDQASINKKGGNGGGLDELTSPLRMTTGGIGGPAEAGDPLNKPFIVSDPFGVPRGNSYHKGIDLCPADDTNDAQVGAVYGGKVTAVGYEEGGAGNYVFYQTPDGMTIKNMHMKDGSIPGNITEGATIKPGDKLGDMGSTGHSSGPHLHYQIEKDGSPIDPSPFIDGSKALSSFNGGSAPGGSNGSKPAGPLAALLGGLQNAGTAYLNKISGGLMGNKGTSNSSGSGSSSGGASFNGLTNGPVQKQVFDYLKSKGYSTAAAAGIMGNIQQESGFRPDAIEDNGEGHGLMQWSYDRKTGLFSFADSNNKQWSDTELQLEYFNKEMEDGTIDKYLADGSGTVSAAGTSPISGGLSEFKQQTDPATAARLFEGAYERAGKPIMEKRVAAAEAFNKEFDGKGGKGGGLDEMFSNVKSSIGGKIGSTVKNGLSSIGDRIFGSNSKKQPSVPANPIPSFAPKTPMSTGENTELTPDAVSNQNTFIDQTRSDNSESGTTGNIEALLMQVLSELKSINNHTANSSGQLETLNQKDFVDTGMRESINQLGKVKSNKPQMPFNQGNIRAVNAIIKPS